MASRMDRKQLADLAVLMPKRSARLVEQGPASTARYKQTHHQVLLPAIYPTRMPCCCSAAKARLFVEVIRPRTDRQMQMPYCCNAQCSDVDAKMYW